MFYVNSQSDTTISLVFVWLPTSLHLSLGNGRMCIIPFNSHSLLPGNHSNHDNKTVQLTSRLCNHCIQRVLLFWLYMFRKAATVWCVKREGYSQKEWINSHKSKLTHTYLAKSYILSLKYLRNIPFGRLCWWPHSVWIIWISHVINGLYSNTKMIDL